ncbi:MAG: carboxypeptidase regulatory-like domain-containing protein [Lentisphaerae bacterium]|nr:carboxypeptidase regulatory-like domain-containing protein [Lentisphaerota bacterium]
MRSELRVARVILSLALCGVAGAAEWRTAKIGVRVVDDAGQPVGGAAIGMGVTGSGPKGIARGFTDTNGLFAARSTMVGSLYLRAEKSGYYLTSGELWDGPSSTERAPPTNQYTVVLKRILNPVPMKSWRVDKALPRFDQDLGFDLEAGDWVVPHGAGQVSDVIVRASYRDNGARDYEKKLTLFFPSALDGLLALDGPDKTSLAVASDLPVPQIAPLAGYTNGWLYTRSRRPGEPPMANMKEPGRQYVFRVRTRTNETGNIVAANYGWILGDFDLRGPAIDLMMRYYFNPDPHSRSLEPSKF